MPWLIQTFIAFQSVCRRLVTGRMIAVSSPFRSQRFITYHYPQKRRLIILISTIRIFIKPSCQHGPSQSESLDAKERECCRCRKEWVSCPTHRIEGVPYNTSFIGPNISVCIAYAPPVPTAKSRCTVEWTPRRVPCVRHVPRQIDDAAAMGVDPPEAVVIGRLREAS